MGFLNAKTLFLQELGIQALSGGGNHSCKVKRPVNFDEFSDTLRCLSSFSWVRPQLV